MPRRRSLLDDLALPIGIALLAVLVAMHAGHLWSVTRSGATDFRFLREATAEAASGRSLYLLRTAHGNLNPPHFHLIVLPFTRLSPATAFLAWTAVSVLSTAASLRLIVRELKITLSGTSLLWTAIAALGLAATAASLWTGQSSLLLTWPATIAWVAARRRQEGRSGAWMGGLLSLKAFLLVFLPYWVLRRHVRALVAAIVVIAIACGVGIVIYGSAEYARWVATLRTANWVDEPWNASLVGMLVRAAGGRTMLVNVAWWLGAAAILVASLVRGAQGTGASAVDRAFACLICGALLASPLGWIHYLWWAAGPLVALLVADPSRWWTGWRRPITLIAAGGLFWPGTALGVAGASPMAQATVASAYFWGVLAVWVLAMGAPAAMTADAARAEPTAVR